MIASFTRLPQRCSLPIAGLVLFLAMGALAIPPRNVAEMAPYTIHENGTIWGDLDNDEREMVVQSIDGALYSTTVLAAKPGPWLGIGSAEASDALDAQLGLPHGEGLVVLMVVTNSPAQKAGLQKNDVLIEFEGQRLVHPAQFRKLLQMKGDGDKIEITLFRGGKKQVVSAKLEIPPASSDAGGEKSGRTKIEIQALPVNGIVKGISNIPPPTIAQPTKASPGQKPVVSSASKPPGRSTYMQRQGWKADLRTLIAMAKWLVAPEPPASAFPTQPEPITTSITEVVHGRDLGNI